MSLFDLSAVVGMLSTQTITVEIPNSTTYAANGVANARTYAAPVSARASVQPGVSDLKKLPEGELVTEWVTIHATMALPEGAKVTLEDGSLYEVRMGDDWRPAGNFSKAMAKRYDKDEPRS